MAFKRIRLTASKVTVAGAQVTICNLIYRPQDDEKGAKQLTPRTGLLARAACPPSLS